MARRKTIIPATPDHDDNGDTLNTGEEITVTLRGRAAAQLRQLVTERRHLSPAQVVAALLQGEMDRRTNEQTLDNFWDMTFQQGNEILDSMQADIDAIFASFQADIDAGNVPFDPATQSYRRGDPLWSDEDWDDNDD